MRWPSLSSSPWILLYPQFGFSRVIRATSAARMSLIGGRPRRFGWVRFSCTRRRCQRRIVFGVTRRWQRSARGSRRMRAAKIARSAQSMRGRGLVRRRTATSWRSTRSSTSLAADVRHDSRTSPSTCQKIKYSNRSDTPGSCLTSDHRWSATPARLLAPHGRRPATGAQPLRRTSRLPTRVVRHHVSRS